MASDEILMPYTPFVTIEDLLIYMQGLGIGVSLNANQTRQLEQRYASLVAGACQEWERVTGYAPFVVQQDSQGLPVASTRNYNRVENGLLDLRTGIVGPPQRLTTLDSRGAVVSTLALSPSYCFPENAEAEGKPYTYLKFYESSQGGAWNAVRDGGTEGLPVFTSGGCPQLAVTAYFGYCLPGNVPDLAKNAVLSRACLEPAFGSSLAAILAAGGATSLRQGDIQISYAPHLLLEAFRLNSTVFASSALLFRRARLCG